MRFRNRDQRGATTIALTLVLAFFVILPLGLLGFEVSRFLLTNQMLRGAADAAALAGSAAIASSNTALTYSDREDWAMYVAGYTFQQNSVLSSQMSTACPNGNITLFGATSGNPLYTGGDPTAGADTGVVPTAGAPGPQGGNPTLRQAKLDIVLIDNTGKMTDDTGGGTPGINAAVQVGVIAYYTDKASFASDILPLGQFTVVAISRAGLPIIDLDLCFDCSGSMDDQSPVMFVNRAYNGTAGIRTVTYTQVSPVSSPPGTISNLYNVLGPNITGTPVNISPPQNLQQSSFGQSGSAPSQTGNSQYYLWSENNFGGTFGGVNGLRSSYNCTSGVPAPVGAYTAIASPSPATAYEQGLPPGNFDKNNLTLTTGNGLSDPSSLSIYRLYTDLVMDIPTIVNNWAALNPGGSVLPTPTMPAFLAGATTPAKSAALLCEAARGNLEDVKMLGRAIGYRQPTAPYAPIVGQPVPPAYLTAAVGTNAYRDYWAFVANYAEPIATARVAAYEFFNTMHISANSHFGLVCFSDTAPVPASYLWTAPGGSGNLPAVTPCPPGDDNYVANIDGLYLVGNDAGGTNGGFAAGHFLVPGVNINSGTDNWGDGSSGNPVPLSIFGSPAEATVSGTTVTDSNVSPQFGQNGGGNTPCLIALGGTDINAALSSAWTDITTAGHFRTNATNRAIILFTDGVPDQPSFNGGRTAANTTATNIGAANIPIYTIGLATNAAIEPYEDEVLGDGNAADKFNGSMGLNGIAEHARAAGAIQSQYFPATLGTLNTAFQSVARSLCVIQ